MPKFVLIVFLFPCLLISQTYNYYFGNLHAHTAFSDGNKDSTSTGINTPAESYAYAAMSQDFDFLGISEHNHYSSNKNPGFLLPRYKQGLRMADSMNSDGNFVSMFGMEYGISSNNNGHVIIYGFDSLIGWESNVGGNSGPNYNIYNSKSDYGNLFKKVKNKASAFCYLAHPFWTDFTLDGTDSTAIAFYNYNAMFDSAIVAVPLRSGNAFSTFDNYSDYAPQNYFNYFKKMLNMGYHIGMGYDHDNHYSNFGRSNGGRLVALMPSLSKTNLMDAMKQMRFYGSDDSNAQLKFEVNGNVMGSVLQGEFYPEIKVQHTDPDGELCDTLRIWKGYKGSSVWAYTVQTVVGADVCTFKDNNVYPGTEYYYFAELRQKDGQWMVSSPIWYKPNTSLGFVDNNKVQKHFDLFPQPAKDFVNLSFPDEDFYELKISDISGRVVYMHSAIAKQWRINIEGIAPGIYELRVQNGHCSFSKKLVKN